MFKKIIILLLLLSLFPCDNILNRIRYSEPATIRVVPDIYELLDKAVIYRDFEFENAYEFETPEEFLYFKSGHILNGSEVNAIAVKCQADTTYMLKLYSLNDLKWHLEDSISNLEGYPWQFGLTFDDYNFDDQTDIYIQVSASNGWSLSRGHLIIIDPKSKKLQVHKEARYLANMTIDPNTKTILTEEWKGYDSLDFIQLTIYKSKWIHGQLKVIEKRDTTFK